MASAKRKLVGDNGSVDYSTKRRKSDAKDSANNFQSKSSAIPDKKETDGPTKKPAPVSVLAKEQPAFPRGGASILTPIERKQIQAKASRDAVQEYNKSQDLFKQDGSDRSVSSDEDSNVKSKSRPDTQRKTSKKSKTAKEGASREAITKIGGLNYKRITTGSLILGQVTSIASRDLTVSLPNNLVGYVPITSISTQFSEKLQKSLNTTDDSSESEDEELENKEDGIELEKHFNIGQYLRVSVTSTVDEGTADKSHSRKKLELTLEPSIVNIGLNKTGLVVGCVIQVSVSSIEDHGLVVDLGLDGSDVKGFVPAKALPPNRSLASIPIGSVFLCHVTSVGSNGKIVKVSADMSKAGVLKNASSVDSFLPGTRSEILITEVQEAGLAGKIMGMLDVTADLVHSGSYADKDAYLSRYKVGKRIQGRILCNFPLSDEKKLGFSVLEEVTQLSTTTGSVIDEAFQSIATILKDATVIRVEPGLGIYLRIGEGKIGFAHISRLSDKKIDSVSEVSGSYKVGTQHNARITDFNPIDGLYLVSLQQKVLDQPFLRIQDVPVGKVVKGTIEKLLIGPAGIKGIIVNLADGVSGYVPEIHLSDIVLQHPEKKFREGNTVTARVLSKDLLKRQIRLTFKKSLVNSDARIWSNFDEIEVGNQTVGTLVKVDSNGALVQFYGLVKGFLPVAEMSEAYIKDAREHFRTGQVLTVNAISVNAEQRRLTLSCRENTTNQPSTETVLSSLKSGSLVDGIVFEKSQNDVLLRLDGSDAIARLTVDHVADGSLRKRQSALDKLRVGQRLEHLLILDVQTKRRLVVMSNRASLVKAAQEGKFLNSFENLDPGRVVTGFVSNITPDGVFISYASRISALLSKNHIPIAAQSEPDFGMTKFQPVTATILSVDYKGATPRFWLTMRDIAEQKLPSRNIADQPEIEDSELVEPVDLTLKSKTDLSVNKVTKARIVSVKDTQLNVELAKDVQGRVDVSEVFDDWSKIGDRKKPLGRFSPKQIIDVKILGAHDTRNHRFLPLTHRSGKTVVYELTAKPSSVKNDKKVSLTLQDMKVGTSWLGYVNNIADGFLWINISPSIRGRLRAVDVSDDLSLAANLETNFPVGSALRVRVAAIDEEKGRLDLTARSGDLSKDMSLNDLSEGLILPGRVTKVTDRQILVQLSDNIVGAVDLIDLADDYSEADPTKHQKNEIVRVCVIRVDIPNKKVALSLRLSKVLSSTLKATDPELSDIKQLKVNDVYRGFIRNIDDKGIFVALGYGITAFIRIGHLSDAYLKDWKDHFQRDQLVKGKIILVDHSSGHVQMSLKESVLTSEYVPPITFTNLKVGDIITGKVAKVESFGVFILVDNSENVRGLCHRSEIADRRVEDASKLFNEDDTVKAKVLKVDSEKRRINFGMKASYLTNQVDKEVDEDESDDNEAEEISTKDSDDDAVDASGVALSDDSENLENGEPHSLSREDLQALAEEDGINQSDEDVSHSKNQPSITALKVGGFDWTGISDITSTKKRNGAGSDTDDARSTDKPKKRKRRAEIEIDRTGDLDANGPQSVDDYERLLLGEPDSSLLWLQYMAFHLDLGDVDQARQIGERALKSIGLGQDAEKMNVWVALLNLENAYGDDEAIESMFKRACEYNDAQEMHLRLASIYIQSGKYNKADDLFQQMVKKFTQDPKVWLNYATFLFDKAGKADQARDLLPRALQTLPKFTHLDITSKFAQLEFKSSSGIAERGRTIFEGLLSSFPKRMDLYNVLLDFEMKLNDQEQIRALFERIFSSKLKTKQAKYFFKRWLAYEEKEGDERKIEDVKARAATWIRSAGNDSV